LMTASILALLTRNTSISIPEFLISSGNRNDQ
jgi:hypothetical protein